MKIDEIITLALEEDIGDGDHTSLSTIPDSAEGKAKLIINFGGYRECEDKDGKTRAFKGVSPLDESLWILHNRGAYKS